MAYDRARELHLEWLGYAQPEGLVVSVQALLNGNAVIDTESLRPLQQAFLDCLPDADDPKLPGLHVLGKFLGWPDRLFQLAPETASVALPELNDVLKPTYVFEDYGTPGKYLFLAKELPDVDPDAAPPAKSKGWNASPQARFERLLRESNVPIGVLATPSLVRLVYAPAAESSGHVTFRVADMAKTAGRPLLGAMHLLLCQERLLAGEERTRLAGLLAASRRFQNDVSTELAGQVLDALYELLRGFEGARHQPGGERLREALDADPNEVYRGLLTVLMRLVFLLYAEDRNLLPNDSIYQNNYSVGGLFEKLRADSGLHQDVMDSRYGAWARLLSLFRIVYEGAQHGGDFQIPAREGYLFAPHRYKFLAGSDGMLPRISDGTIYRVLAKLLLLKGERLSYRTLDVEQIGSVYEVTMGFELRMAEGVSVAIKPPKTNGAPVTLNLEALLAVKPADRGKRVKELTSQTISGRVAGEKLKTAKTIEDLLSALDSKIELTITPNPVSAGAMIFQPSLERRHSGSNYTPRSLTEPIVRETLAPVLANLGPNPTPNAILALRVCDPAMGSGAFLVEACRQLGARLALAWQAHDETPGIPPDEDIQLAAQRVVAQRCLYGVDRNPMAADLAKLSLWLATLAKDHAFTFLNHSMRSGDSLVGCTVDEISYFRWEDVDDQVSYYAEAVKDKIGLALRNRKFILDARDQFPYATLQQHLDNVEFEIEDARLTGDALVSAYFSNTKRAKRLEARNELAKLFNHRFDAEADDEIRRAVAALHAKGLRPFHWELEFPEVFPEHGAAGFDAIIGNPPFAGKNTLIDGNPEGYVDWLKQIHPESHGNADVVAHFFRRAFLLLRPNGCFGLIATNTIGQGDTRSTGLRWICSHGGTIYRAKKRLKWPGEAAVVVSVVFVKRGAFEGPVLLNEKPVPKITAFLFHDGGNEDPATLRANANKSFIGSYILGMGFTFDDTDTKGVASPIAEMQRLIEADPRNGERIFPFLGGEEVNVSPVHGHHRYVINFEDFPLEKAEQWPAVLEVVRSRVKPERDKLGGNPDAERRKRHYWLWGRYTPSLFESLRGKSTCLVTNCGAAPHLCIARVSAHSVFAHSLVVFPFDGTFDFAVLQSGVHEVWARFMASSMKDDLRYTPTDCFETFPFPADYESSAELASIGEAYYNFRAELMVRTNRGMTKTYNRFHDPNENNADIVQLRELHAELDRAVLRAYGWEDLALPYDFQEEFETTEDDAESFEALKKQARKKYRLRWESDTHDRLLARLLLLNQERAAAEVRMPAAARSRKPSKRGQTETLF